MIKLIGQNNDGTINSTCDILVQKDIKRIFDSLRLMGISIKIDSFYDHNSNYRKLILTDKNGNKFCDYKYGMTLSQVIYN